MPLTNKLCLAAWLKILSGYKVTVLDNFRVNCISRREAHFCEKQSNVLKLGLQTGC